MSQMPRHLVLRSAVLTVLLLALAAAAGAAPAKAERGLVYAVEIDSRTGSVEEARLECGSALVVDGHPSMTLRNAGDEAATLHFSDGSVEVLQPGEEALVAEAVIGTHKCVCKCTCSGDGFSESISFECPSSTNGTDPCPNSNGSNCLTTSGKTGTTSGCSRWYIPV